MTEHEKDPRRVQAGQKAQRSRLERLGEVGYRQAQRENAHASNKAQIEAKGVDGYRKDRQNAFQALVDKIGPIAAKQRMKNGTEASRKRRLAQPTRGEIIAQAAVAKLGFHVLRPELPIELFDILHQPDNYPDIAPNTAIAECYINNRWIGDIVLPFRHLVIEVNGGCHRLRCDKDTYRKKALEALGLGVVVLHDDDEQPLTIKYAMHLVGEQLGICH